MIASVDMAVGLLAVLFGAGGIGYAIGVAAERRRQYEIARNMQRRYGRQV